MPAAIWWREWKSCYRKRSSNSGLPATMKSSPSVAGSPASSGQAFVPFVLVLVQCFLAWPVASAPAATSDGKPLAADTTWQTVLDASEPLDPPNEWAKQEPTDRKSVV